MQSVHPWPYARVSAHRGAGTMAPENTLEGFRAGLHHGFHAFETDAMLAKDGIPVLMHDERFGRTIERVGVDEFIRQLKSDDVLSRKDEILAVAAKAKGGASC